jgi:Xaa-Pro aminopeptidase
MAEKILKSRLNIVRKALAESNADCLVVTKPANVTYITGFTGDDSWAVVLPKKVVLVTDSRYTEQAKHQCRSCSILNRTASMVQTIARLLQKRPAGQKTAVEMSTSMTDFKALSKLLSGRLKPVADVIESARRKKHDAEIAAIRTASKIASHALERTRRLIRPGLTENELAGLIDLQIRKLGAKNCFETIAAFGPNASRPHHQPTNRKLSKNDTVLIDFGVRYNGYCCDITRCFAVGAPAPLFRRVYAAVELAQAAALKMVRTGAEIAHVDAAARNVIKKTGLPVYGHGTGHGLGLEIHEMPVVSNKTKDKLLPGDVITIEPAVYLPGCLGVRIEDDVLVTDNGYIMLTYP